LQIIVVFESSLPLIQCVAVGFIALKLSGGIIFVGKET